MKNKGIFNLNQILRKINSLISSGSIQRRLGYSKNAKLLIIHADDLGMSASENSASIEAMENGMVNSGSVMVNCPCFEEIIDYSKTHPQSDIGIHLTLTSEWPSYKWKPLLSSDEVPSVVDDNGLFYLCISELIKNCDPDEIEKELRAQIILAKESGIDVTHLDSHMFAAFSDKEILKIYIKLGKEFLLPVLLTNELPLRYLISKNRIVVDNLFYARKDDAIKGLDNYYRKTLSSLKPGLNCILVHLAYDNNEMRDIAPGQFHFNYGSAWRQADFDFFTSNECRQLVKNNNIQLITWREIRDKLVR